MEAVRDGDLRKLAVLFERHHRNLFHFFLRITGQRELSEDLVQEVFFRILRYRHTFSGQYPFSAWIYQIARNAHMDHLQKRRHEALPEQEPASDAPHPDEKFARKQEAALVRLALERLPEDKREVLVLSRYQNLKYEEIAQILGIEVGAVKVRVYRAVRQLAQIFGELSGGKSYELRRS